MKRWTAEDQAVAEVAAACGVTMEQIARLLAISPSTVRRRLKPYVMERLRHYQQAYYQENRTAYKERNSRNRRANPALYNEINKRWRQNNLEHVRACVRRNCRTFRERHPGWDREQYLKNPERRRHAAKRRDALKRAARIRSLVPLTIEQKKHRFRLFSNCCAYCFGTFRLSEDHVQCLHEGGLDMASNIVPACSRCNSSKGTSPVEDWYRRQPFFTEARWQRILRHCPHIATGQLPLAIPA